jgi:hypothetical protein
MPSSRPSRLQAESLFQVVDIRTACLERGMLKNFLV